MAGDNNKTTWTDEYGRIITRGVIAGSPETTEEHPSYGLVKVSRIQGHPGPLFGSQLRDHGTFIGLKIKRGERSSHDGRDWYLSRGDLIEVWLSAAQFAELLTTMNMGSGVPCTIKRIWDDDGYHEVPPVPKDEAVESDRVNSEFKAKMSRLNVEFSEAIQGMLKFLDQKGPVPAGKKNEFKKLVEKIDREISANMPYWLKSFQESVEKTVVSAKSEVDAMMTSVIQRAGLKAIQSDPAGAVKQLTEGGEADGEKG